VSKKIRYAPLFTKWNCDLSQKYYLSDNYPDVLNKRIHVYNANV